MPAFVNYSQNLEPFLENVIYFVSSTKKKIYSIMQSYMILEEYTTILLLSCGYIDINLSSFISRDNNRHPFF